MEDVHEASVGMDMEGWGRGVFQGTIRMFVCWNWG